jgi:hypothetical protein
MVPGKSEIAEASCALMKSYEAIVWAHHGLFAAGPDFDTTFGLAHTIEKAAEIYLAARAANGGSDDFLNRISDQDLRDTCRDFFMQGAIRAAEDDFENDVCGTTLAALSGQDVAFVRAMAQDDRPSRMCDIAERMGQTQDYAQKYRRRLIDAGVISAAGHGYVTFAVPYMREYLRRMELDW